jgi:hypothetical protein
MVLVLLVSYSVSQSFDVLFFVFQLFPIRSFQKCETYVGFLAILFHFLFFTENVSVFE